MNIFGRIFRLRRIWSFIYLLFRSKDVYKRQYLTFYVVSTIFYYGILFKLFMTCFYWCILIVTSFFISFFATCNSQILCTNCRLWILLYRFPDLLLPVITMYFVLVRFTFNPALCKSLSFLNIRVCIVLSTTIRIWSTAKIAFVVSFHDIINLLI